MNYRGKRIAITGARGFLGSALNRRLMGLVNPPLPNKRDENIFSENVFDQLVGRVNITYLQGDIRDPQTFQVLDHSFDYLFHFAAPSSQVLFKTMPEYCIESTVKGFMNAAEACKRNGIRLIYPSTGILSLGNSNEYARCKQICEDLALGSGMNALGLRIFATYGPGEGHKSYYASPPYLFARDMVNGRAPVIWGDGSQKRDFIYVDDTVEAILTLAEEATEPIIDVGSGASYSFNEVLMAINEHLDVKVDPVYIPKPSSYVDETLADVSSMEKYYKRRYALSDGIKKVIDSLQKGAN